MIIEECAAETDCEVVNSKKCLADLVDLCHEKCESYKASIDKGTNEDFKKFEKKDVLEACKVVDKGKKGRLLVLKAFQKVFTDLYFLFSRQHNQMDSSLSDAHIVGFKSSEATTSRRRWADEDGSTMWREMFQHLSFPMGLFLSSRQVR